jgi:hypothetical protein
LIFDCGPLGEGGHGHYDLLSVEVAAAGGPLLVDPGRFTYSEGPPNLRRWFKGTAAHNTVCVDGRDQTAYRRGKPKGPVARGRLLERLGAPGFDLLRGLAASPRYDAVHERAIAFMAGEYWLIVDRLRAGEPHDYDLRFHLAPEATGATRVDRGAGNAAVRAPGLALAFAAGAEPRLVAGWHSPAYGVKLDAPIVSVRAAGVADHDYHTLVAPLAGDDAAPTLHVITAPDPDASVLEVARGDGARDLVAWSASTSTFDLGAVRCHAHAAWLCESQRGGSASLLAFDAEEAWTDSGAPFLPKGGADGWSRWEAGS